MLHAISTTFLVTDFGLNILVLLLDADWNASRPFVAPGSILMHVCVHVHVPKNEIIKSPETRKNTKKKKKKIASDKSLLIIFSKVCSDIYFGRNLDLLSIKNFARP